MFRLIFFFFVFIFVCRGQSLNSARSVNGQLNSAGRNVNNRENVVDSRLIAAKDLARQQYQQARSREISSSFVQSRRFHKDQNVRNSGSIILSQPSISNPTISIGHFALPSNVVGSSQEGCRLTNNFCARDYQCCSGKCRCVRWSVMGKMSCYKKCF